MKQRGVEVLYRFRSNKENITRVRLWPWALFLFPFFLFIPCVVIHTDMTLKTPNLMNFFLFFLRFTCNLKKYWMVNEMWLPFSIIQWDWRLTHRSLKNAWNLDFSKFSVSIQWTFGNASVDWKENIHPVQQIKNGVSLKRIKNK